MKKLTGCFTAIVTPFDHAGNIDFEALDRVLDFQIKSGVDGIVVCGSTGEAATLNIQEYKSVIEFVVRKAKEKVYVIAGAGSNDTEKAVHNSLIAKEAGVKALLHVTPYYNKPTSTGLYLHFKKIADKANLPIILYNVPGRTGSNVSAEVTLNIAKKVDNLIAVKEASGDINQIMNLIKGASDSFSVLSGDDSITLPLISLGGRGCISVVSNQIPKDFTKLIRYALQGNYIKARELHYKYMNLMNVNFIETNPLPVKTALFMMGMIQEEFRLPLCRMENKTKKILTVRLKEIKLI